MCIRDRFQRDPVKIAPCIEGERKLIHTTYIHIYKFWILVLQVMKRGHFLITPPQVIFLKMWPGLIAISENLRNPLKTRMDERKENRRAWKEEDMRVESSGFPPCRIIRGVAYVVVCTIFLKHWWCMESLIESEYDDFWKLKLVFDK